MNRVSLWMLILLLGEWPQFILVKENSEKLFCPWNHRSRKQFSHSGGGEKMSNLFLKFSLASYLPCFGVDYWQENIINSGKLHVISTAFKCILAKTLLFILIFNVSIDFVGPSDERQGLPYQADEWDSEWHQGVEAVCLGVLFHPESDGHPTEGSGITKISGLLEWSHHIRFLVRPLFGMTFFFFYLTPNNCFGLKLKKIFCG